MMSTLTADEILHQLKVLDIDYQKAKECEYDLEDLEDKLRDKRMHVERQQMELQQLNARVEKMREFKRGGRTMQSIGREVEVLKRQLQHLREVENERRVAQMAVAAQRCRQYCVDNGVATHAALDGMTFRQIILKALTHHNDALLTNQSFPVEHEYADGCNGGGKCTWDYGDRKCLCGDRRFTWEVSEDDLLTRHTLDSSEPEGCVQPV